MVPRMDGLRVLHVEYRQNGPMVSWKEPELKAKADIAQLDKFKEPNGLNENLGKTDQPIWDLAGAA